MPFADINGIRMNYSVQGEGEPVLLITGFGGDTTFYHSLIPALPDYRTIVFDNRGAGLTEYPGPFVSQDLVDDVCALLDHLSIYRAHVVGWSMGAHIAQEFAIQNPERTLSLTLISAYMWRPARSSYMMGAMVRAAFEGMNIDYLNMMINAFCFTEDYFSMKEQKNSKIKVPKGITAEGLRDQGNGAIDMFDTRGRVGLIKAPTLSIHGLADIMVEPKMGDEIAEQIPNCRKYRIPNIGHIIHPSMYVDELRRHLVANSSKN